MTIFLDTNVLIRFLTLDDKIRAAKVQKLLETETDIEIPEAAFPEVEYILKTVEKAKHDAIAKAFDILASRKNVTLTKETSIAIYIYQTTKLDMADCLIAAHSLKGKLASFDKDLLKVPGITPFWQ